MVNGSIGSSISMGLLGTSFLGRFNNSVSGTRLTLRDK